MYFYKQTFSDANENIFYTLLRNIKGMNFYQPYINYTYNYDA